MKNKAREKNLKKDKSQINIYLNNYYYVNKV